MCLNLDFVEIFHQCISIKRIHVNMYGQFIRVPIITRLHLTEITYDLQGGQFCHLYISSTSDRHICNTSHLISFFAVSELLKKKNYTFQFWIGIFLIKFSCRQGINRHVQSFLLSADNLTDFVDPSKCFEISFAR